MACTRRLSAFFRRSHVRRRGYSYREREAEGLPTRLSENAFADTKPPLRRPKAIRVRLRPFPFSRALVRRVFPVSSSASR